MLVKLVDELLGDEVLARDGRFGLLEDLYFDRDCWQVSYLLVGQGRGHMLVSTACVAVAAPARDQVLLALSGAQLRSGAGAWPIDAASHWLDEARICSAREAIGWRILGEDGLAGRLTDLLVDDASWSIEYLVASADASGAQQVLLPLDWIDSMESPDDGVRVRRTRAQLCDAPRV